MEQLNAWKEEDFTLPVENLFMASWFKDLATWFSKAIDGEIPYQNLQIDDLDSIYVAIEFFGEDKKDKINEKDINDWIQRIEEKLSRIDSLEKYIQNTSFTSSAAKTLYSESLKEYKNKFLMFREAIWIEAEKGWYKLDPVKKYHHQNEVEKLHKDIWWESKFDSVDDKLKFRKNRVQRSHDEVKIAYENKKDSLTDHEKYVVESYLWILFRKYSLNEKPYLIHEEKSSDQPLDDSMLNKLLSPTQQVLVFNAIIKLEQELNEKKWAIDPKKWKTKIDENSANMSANQSNEQINLPWKWDRETWKVIEKYGHEYALHWYTWMWSNTFLWPSFKWAKYLRHEEVHTYLKELVNNGSIQRLDDLNKILRLTDEKTRAILVCELYPAAEAEEILAAFSKLWLSELASMTPKKRVQRTNRFFPRDTPWHSDKDRVYLMEQKKVLDRYLESKSMVEFMEKLDFASRYKLNIEQYPLARQMESDLDIKDKYINKDHYTSRLLYRALEWNNTTPSHWSLDYLILQKWVDISELLSNVNNIINLKI